MKITMVLAVASLALAGCGSMDFFGDSNDSQVQSPPSAAAGAAPTGAATDQASTTQTAAASAVPSTASPSAHCTALANLRAQDAAYQGEDTDTQASVHARTYAECVALDLKHALR